MKPYLVDVPVRVNIWIRPECQRRQFEVIKKARPSTIFLISDGGRNEKEMNIIKKHREMFENEIDWDCKVYKLFFEENQGMYTIGKKVMKLIWEKTDRCIFLEDDLIPSVSYFRFCAEMLERYKDDLRVCRINGVNHVGCCNEVNADYFFSRVGSIWGFATWRRVHEHLGDFSYADDSYTNNLILHNLKKYDALRKRVINYPHNPLYEGHPAAGEFIYDATPFLYNQLNIIPKKNMISNMGCTADATHSAEWRMLPKGIRKVFNMKVYEIDFHIKHTSYMVPDYDYEKKLKRIMGWNHPVVNTYRKVESTIKRIIYGDFKGLMKSACRRIRGKKKIEK